ncbi:hypothetical protein FBU30_002327, partial [Linnemannia zychae]
MPPHESSEVSPIQLPLQPISMSRRRASRIIPRADIIAAAATTAAVDIDIIKPFLNDTANNYSKSSFEGSNVISTASLSSSEAGSSESSNNTMNLSPLAWL